MSHVVVVDVGPDVVTGAAASDWTRLPDGGDLERSVSVQTEVLQSRLMVRRKWRDELDAPAFEPCLRTWLTRWSASRGDITLASLRRVPFPRLGQQAAAYRIVTGITSAHLPALTEFAVLLKGRTEIDCPSFAATNAEAWVAAETVRLARVLAGRIEA